MDKILPEGQSHHFQKGLRTNELGDFGSKTYWVEGLNFSRSR